MDAFYNALLSAGDLCFGWLLSLPSDVTLVAIAILTSLIFIVVRLFTTDQAYLKKCAADKTRLGELIAEAKKAGNKPAVQRFRTTVGQIGFKLMWVEVKPTLVALIPVGFLATWCLERIEFHPPKARDPIEVSFHLPVSASGQLVHLTPVKGLASEGGWIRRMGKEEGDPLASMAAWKISFEEPGSHELLFRYADKTFSQTVQVGQKHYAPKYKFYPDGDKYASVVNMRPRMLFGVVPGIDALAMAPWMVGYLFITIPLVFINKKLFGVE